MLFVGFFGTTLDKVLVTRCSWALLTNSVPNGLDFKSGDVELGVRGS